MFTTKVPADWGRRARWFIEGSALVAITILRFKRPSPDAPALSTDSPQPPTIQTADVSAQQTFARAFVSKDSLTFFGAVAIVCAILRLLAVEFYGADQSFWWALGVSSVLGGVIFGLNLTPGDPPIERWKDAAITAINVLLLAATALGVYPFRT